MLIAQVDNLVHYKPDSLRNRLYETFGGSQMHLARLCGKRMLAGITFSILWVLNGNDPEGISYFTSSSETSEDIVMVLVPED